jgi:UDP-N-acetylglucosamine 1-carboxyvinyltransferase
MGASIQVFGQERIEIAGVESLSGVTHRVIPDNMEALTWLVAGVITQSDLEIIDFPVADLEVPLIFLRESGARYHISEDRLIVRGGTCYPVEISTGTFPGINSDMQPLFASYAARANGKSKIIDLRFPGRYAYVREMEKMGLRYSLDGNVLTINGTGKLTGASVKATDLRAGISLVMSGLFAECETKIEDAWQIERGYDRFVEKLQNIGGDISTVA